MSYIVPIHRPSGVRHATKLDFLGTGEDALVVAFVNHSPPATPANIVQKGQSNRGL